MAAPEMITDDVVVIDVGSDEWQDLIIRDIELAAGSCGSDDYIEYTDDDLNLRVAKSYENNPSSGLTLAGKVAANASLLKQLSPEAIKILDYNVDQKDLFPNATDIDVIKQDLIKKIKAVTGIDLDSSWASTVAGGIFKAMQDAKSNYQTSNGDSTFNRAAKNAMTQTQNPTSNYDTLFHLKDFLIKAYVSFFGLDFLSGNFDYNFGADLLFSPRLYTSKTGIGRITANVYQSRGYNDGSKPKKQICTKCLILYNGTIWQRATPDLPLSFGFQAKDLPTTQYPVYDYIIEKQLCRQFEGDNENPPGAPNWNSYFLQAKAKYLANQSWNSGASPIVFDNGGIATRMRLNLQENTGSGVMEVIFGFNFGEKNGSLWISNMFATFQINVDNYITEVQFIKQYMARCREAAENYARKIEQKSKEVPLPPAPAPEPEPDNKLDLGATTNGTTNYATRDGAVDVPRDNIDSTTANPPGSTQQNSGNATWFAPDEALATDPSEIP